MQKKTARFAFFGTPEIAAVALDELEKAGYLPSLIVTAPDRAKGRGLALAAPPVKSWGLARGIEVIQPEKINSQVLENFGIETWDVFIVVAYGTILPKAVLEIPRRGTLNIHPSLLPRFRGPSPVRSAILAGEETGVSVMLLDEKMDHGPLIAQKKVASIEMPPRAMDFERALVREGARLLAQVLPGWLDGSIHERAQNHDVATYCEKFTKEDGLLDPAAGAEENMRKIRAFEGWPGTYAFFERPGRSGTGKKIRVAILDAKVENGTLSITRVKPEGKKEMAYDEFLRSGAVLT